MQMPFYSNEKIGQQLDLIHHMLQFGDELLLITGEEGVGKSRQLQELIRSLGEGWQICYLSGRENSQVSQLFERVSQSFGYDYSTVASAELLNGFKNHLEQREAGKTYALLIDDAEQLDESALEAVTHLSQLQNSKGPLLRVMLFGAHELSDVSTFKTIPLREVTIEPLDSEQSQDYIDFCIEQGRYEFGQSPSAARQQQIVKRAAGIPGQIEVMLQNSSQPLNGWKKIVDWRVGAVALLLLAASIGYLLNSGGEVPNTASALKSDSPTSLQQPVTRNSVTVTPPVVPAVTKTAPPVPVQNDSEAALISDLLQQSEPLIVDPPISVVEKGPDGESEVESDSDSVLENFEQRVVQDVPAGGAESVESQMESQGPPTELPGGSLSDALTETPTETKQDTLDDRVGDRAWFQSQPATSFTIQLVAAEREAALDELIRREQLQKGLARFSFSRGGRIIHVLTQGVYRERSGAEEVAGRYSMAVKPWIRPIGDIQRLLKANLPPVVDSSPADTITDIASVKDSAWLWSQDPEMITIQLVAGGNREMIESFVKQSLKIGVSAILESKKDARPWFIVLHGRYKTRDEARSAIAKFPQQLQSAKPWIRSFASVHDELSRAN